MNNETDSLSKKKSKSFFVRFISSPLFIVAILICFNIPSVFALRRFIDNKDNTIKDDSNGLTWIKNPDLLEETRGVMIWIRAKEACAGLSYAGVDTGSWRLPDIKELQSLLSDSGSPRIDPIFSTYPLPYWSITDYSGPGSNAWAVNFASGQIEVRRKLNLINPELLKVRCVHD